MSFTLLLGTNDDGYIGDVMYNNVVMVTAWLFSAFCQCVFYFSIKLQIAGELRVIDTAECSLH